MVDIETFFKRDTSRRDWLAGMLELGGGILATAAFGRVREANAQDTSVPQPGATATPLEVANARETSLNVVETTFPIKPTGKEGTKIWPVKVTFLDFLPSRGTLPSGLTVEGFLHVSFTAVVEGVKQTYQFYVPAAVYDPQTGKYTMTSAEGVPSVPKSEPDPRYVKNQLTSGGYLDQGGSLTLSFSTATNMAGQMISGDLPASADSTEFSNFIASGDISGIAWTIQEANVADGTTGSIYLVIPGSYQISSSQ